MRTVCLLVVLLMAGTCAGLEANARSLRRDAPVLIGPAPPLEAAGCYYYRGRQWCGRYCYYEVNGKRYCQRREREAVPQAPLDIYPLNAEPGMK